MRLKQVLKLVDKYTTIELIDATINEIIDCGAKYNVDVNEYLKADVLKLDYKYNCLQIYIK